ncbi:MAG: nitrate- and nitrite sensing domain-containing protein, partial [Beijerinckiaceae bacterium]|nr:nitrate- and nitrite sensing domain-containing protein [Beijerinckiaceae bacterium]
MHRFSLRQSLTLLIIVPVICAVIGIVQLYGHIAERLTTARVTERMIGLSDTAAALVHALQVERGSSVGLVSAVENRSMHRNRVIAAQEASDKALESFNEYLAKAKDDRELPKRVQSFVAASASLSEDIKAFRERILTGAAMPPDILGFYTGIINNLIHGSSGSNASSRAEDIATLRSALQSLMLGKEFAGLQRATGNGILSADTVDADLLERFIRVSANQNQALDQMRRQLGEQVETYFDALIPQAMQQALRKSEQSIINYSRDGGEKPMTAAQWWTQTSARIDAMRAAEVKFSERLRKLSADDGADAMWSLLLSLGLQGAAVACGVLFMTWVGASLSKPIRRASDALEQSLRGDPAVVAPPAMSERSEIGRISNAVGRFIEAAAERQKLIDERAAAEARLGESRRTILQQMEREFNEASQTATATLQMAAATLNEKSIAMLGT